MQNLDLTEKKSILHYHILPSPINVCLACCICVVRAMERQTHMRL